MKTISQNCNELFSYIFTRGETQDKRETKSLKYMREFAQLTNLNPHKVKIIHIAGSKGKGSVGIHIASSLKACGYKVGIYTSPHVSHWYERIQILGQAMDEKKLLKVGNYLQKKVIEHNKLTRYNFFEWLTLLAMHYFIESRCDFVVLETGLGGRFDSTNIFKPIATVTTLIEKEHTDILGDTLSEIAFQKGGIIKKGSMNFSYFQKNEVRKVLTHCAQVNQTKCYFLDSEILSFESHITRHKAVLKRSKLPLEFETALMGKHQGYNAILALMVIKQIFKKRFFKYEERMISSFKQAFLPGRFQILSECPLIIVDSAHTSESVKTSCETVEQLSQGREVNILFGCAQGKNMHSMLLSLSKLHSHMMITKPGSFKKSDIEGIENMAHTLNITTERVDDTYQACEKFLEKKGDIYYIVGSFFLVDIFLQVFHQRLNIS